MSITPSFSIHLASLAAKPVIAAMFQPCCTELARFPVEPPLPRDEHGSYLYPYFDLYWRESVRFPYLLLDGDEVAGFTLVRRDGERWDLSEFYVKPEFRGRGLGRACATLVVAKHPGAWHIGFNKANRAGRALWISLAERLSGGRYQHRPVDAYYECVEFSAAGNDIEE